MFRPTSLAFVAALALVCASQASAQVVVQGGGAAGGARGYYPNSQPLMYLLYYPQMQKEIEIIDDQKVELEKIQKEMQAKMSEAYKTFGDAKIEDPQERQKKYMEIYQDISKETDEQVNKLLLPHQKKQLTQIMLQMKLQQSGYGYGFAGALGGDDVAKELGITDAQKEELRKKEEEVRAGMQKKYQEFYKKLQEETTKELMSVLTPAQRKKLEELTGAKFQWQQWQPAVQPPAKVEKKGD
ncbi:MAG: hypothetical protein IAF94_07045 [Pirellulaceae bacterium]|nr:hypothetical protein [Pirellulaceae bacterium]